MRTNPQKQGLQKKIFVFQIQLFLSNYFQPDKLIERKKSPEIENETKKEGKEKFN